MEKDLPKSFPYLSPSTVLCVAETLSLCWAVSERSPTDVLIVPCVRRYLWTLLDMVSTSHLSKMCPVCPEVCPEVSESVSESVHGHMSGVSMDICPIVRICPAGAQTAVWLGWKAVLRVVGLTMSFLAG